MQYNKTLLDLRCLFLYLYHRQYIDRRTQKKKKSPEAFFQKRKIWKQNKLQRYTYKVKLKEYNFDQH